MARKRFMFWLDDKRDEDWEIKSLIDDLKRDRLFSRAIREGLRMWVESQTGETAPTVAKSGDGAGGLDEIKALLEIIAANQKAGIQMSAVGIPTPAPTGKLLGGGKQFSMPVDDDDIPEMVISKSADVSSSARFLEALQSLH